MTWWYGSVTFGAETQEEDFQQTFIIDIILHCLESEGLKVALHQLAIGATKDK